MPSTIGWLATAIAGGTLAGLLIGQWSQVARWLHHCLEDPVGRPADRGLGQVSDEAETWLDQRT